MYVCMYVCMYGGVARIAHEQEISKIQESFNSWKQVVKTRDHPIGFCPQ